MALNFTPNTATTPSTPNYTFRRGLTMLTTVPTPASTLINPGDLMVLDTAGPYARPMHQADWDTNLATTQADVRPVFLGVAMDLKLASDPSTNPILICVEGVFAYACAALGAAQH